MEIVIITKGYTPHYFSFKITNMAHKVIEIKKI